MQVPYIKSRTSHTTVDLQNYFVNAKRVCHAVSETLLHDFSWVFQFVGGEKGLVTTTRRVFVSGIPLSPLTPCRLHGVRGERGILFVGKYLKWEAFGLHI